MNVKNAPDPTPAVGPLIQMSYLSTAFLAVAILAVSAMRLQGSWVLGPVSCGGATLIILAIGTFRRVRWTMAAAMGVAMLMWVAALVSWWTSGGRPPLVCVLVPPIVMAFNFIALYVTAPRED